MHHHKSRFTFGDKVIDLVNVHRQHVMPVKGVIHTITIKENRVIYTVMATGGHPFQALEGALQLESEYLKEQNQKINQAQVAPDDSKEPA